MATKAKKTKFNLDKMVEDAQVRVSEFINTEFAKLQEEVTASFAEARKQSAQKKA
jgi:hypothetical protein